MISLCDNKEEPVMMVHVINQLQYYGAQKNVGRPQFFYRRRLLCLKIRTVKKML